MLPALLKSPHSALTTLAMMTGKILPIFFYHLFSFLLTTLIPRSLPLLITLFPKADVPLFCSLPLSFVSPFEPVHIPYITTTDTLNTLKTLEYPYLKVLFVRYHILKSNCTANSPRQNHYETVSTC